MITIGKGTHESETFFGNLDLSARPGLPSLVFLPSLSSRAFADPFVVVDAFVLLVVVLSRLSRGWKNEFTSTSMSMSMSMMVYLLSTTGQGTMSTSSIDKSWRGFSWHRSRLVLPRLSRYRGWLLVARHSSS